MTLPHKPIKHIFLKKKWHVKEINHLRNKQQPLIVQHIQRRLSLQVVLSQQVWKHKAALHLQACPRVQRKINYRSTILPALCCLRAFSNIMHGAQHIENNRNYYLFRDGKGIEAVRDIFLNKDEKKNHFSISILTIG